MTVRQLKNVQIGVKIKEETNNELTNTYINNLIDKSLQLKVGEQKTEQPCNSI